jgi:hypothetical protein
MADVDGNCIVPLGTFGATAPSGVALGAWDLVGTGGFVFIYKMQAVDPDCGPLTYRTWVVTGAPDFAAAQYAGARCGVTPLTNVVVAATRIV